MGFGRLLIGFVLLYVMPFNSLDCYLKLLGAVLVLGGLYGLRQYRAEFGVSLFAAWPIALINLYLTVSWTLRYCGVGEALPEQLDRVLRNLREGLSYVLVFLLLWAIRAIARELELQTIATVAVRDAAITALYLLLLGVQFVLKYSGGETVASYMNLPLLGMWLVWWLLIFFLLLRCYKNICAPEDAEMEGKPSIFGFVNRIRAKTKERNEAVYQGAKAYSEKKLVERMEEKRREQEYRQRVREQRRSKRK